MPTKDSSFCTNFGLWNGPCPQTGPDAPINETCLNITANMTDLSFCKKDRLAINSTDMPWVLKLHDSYYKEREAEIKSSVKKELQTAGIAFCDTCWDAYLKWLCAAASPECGMATCSQNAAQSAAGCVDACNCDPVDKLFVQPDCHRCVMACYTDAVAPSCGQFGISKNSCKQLVNICGCNPSQQDAETICSDFSEEGFDVNLGNGSCTSAPTWCGLSSGNHTSNFTNISPNNNSSIPSLNNWQAAQPGRLCPNSRVCLSIYNALGANVVANPVTTLQGVDNNGNPGTNGTDSAAAISKCASPLLLLAAIFLLLFV